MCNVGALIIRMGFWGLLIIIPIIKALHYSKGPGLNMVTKIDMHTVLGLGFWGFGVGFRFRVLKPQTPNPKNPSNPARPYSLGSGLRPTTGNPQLKNGVLSKGSCMCICRFACLFFLTYLYTFSYLYVLYVAHTLLSFFKISLLMVSFGCYNCYKALVQGLEPRT